MVEEIKVVFSAKKITAWGGMNLMKDMIDSIGFIPDCSLPLEELRKYECFKILKLFCVLQIFVSGSGGVSVSGRPLPLTVF